MMMKKQIFLVILFFFLFKIQSYSNEIKIIVKVGNEIITNSDLKNEIQTMLLLSGKQINQENIDKVKNVAIQALIRNLIKKNEIKKKYESWK